MNCVNVQTSTVERLQPEINALISLVLVSITVLRNKVLRLPPDGRERACV